MSTLVHERQLDSIDHANSPRSTPSSAPRLNSRPLSNLPISSRFFGGTIGSGSGHEAAKNHCLKKQHAAVGGNNCIGHKFPKSLAILRGLLLHSQLADKTVQGMYFSRMISAWESRHL